jgi:hypothetical protein
MDQGKKYFGLSNNVFFTGLVSFFMDVSSEMIYPLVPLFLANVLGVNKSMIGLIEGIAESPSATFYFGAITAALSAILFMVLIVSIRVSQRSSVS